MKSYAKIIWFVIIMGAVTSVVFVGMEAWTRPLIEANAAIELKSTILDANGIPYTTATIHDVFDKNVSIHYVGDNTLHVDNNSGNISFEFSGSGVWGPITGIITLERDLKTIKDLRVLQQEETPGLGGVVAETGYLSQYRGAEMTPELLLHSGSEERKANEVDAITGATRTSNAFISILNSSYSSHLEALKKIGDQ